MSSRPNNFVSVVVPVYNDAARLGLCLAALEQQSYPANLYEVIVVDNGSDDDLAWVEDEYRHVVLCYEEQAGSYAARNRGISAAKGDVFGFTDSDCIPDSFWIENGVSSLISVPNVGLVGGRVEFFFVNPSKPTAVELYDSIRNLQQESFIRKVKYAATANMFTFRKMFESVGFFDASLKSGGDRVWGQKVASSGFRLVYGREAVVRHPARNSFGQLYKKSVRVIGGTHDCGRRTGYGWYDSRLWKAIALDLSPPLRFVMRLTKDDRVPGALNKLKVTLVFVADKYLKAWTRLRLQFGSMASR